MSVLEELVSRSEKAEERRQDAVAAHAKAINALDELRASLKTDEGERNLTEDEEKRSRELLADADEAELELKEARKEARKLGKRVEEEKEVAERRKRIAEARSDIEQPEEPSEVRVESEPMVYGPGSTHSYYADLIRFSGGAQFGDVDGATQRLARWSHQVEREYADGSEFGRKAEKQIREKVRETVPTEAMRQMAELRDRGRTALEQKAELRTGLTTGGGATAAGSSNAAAFVTPVFYVDRYAPYREYGRAFIDQCHKEPLPDYGMNIYVPHFTGGAEVASQSEGAAVPEKALTAGYISGALVTEAGEALVTQQLLDRTGPNFRFDVAVFDQLNRNYNLRVDTYALEEALAGAKTNNWTGSSNSFILLEKEKSGGFYGQVAKAKSDIRTKAGTVLNPTHLFVRPELWEFISGFADSQSRPTIVPGYAQPFNAAGAGSATGDEGIEGATGNKLVGLPVFCDANIPSHGTTTDQQAVVGCLDEVWVYEGTPITRVIPQTKANELVVILQQYSYITAIKRYAEGVVVINGSGMKVSYTN